MERHNLRSLLIVDGHSGVRAALVRRLSQIPGACVVAAVENLDGARQTLEQQAMDAVLYDPRTVAGDAATAVAQLAASGAAVVVLTSSLREGEEDALQRAGAGAVLLKGVSVAAICASVDAAIAARRSGIS